MENENITLENHRCVLTEHEIVVDGVLFREYKELNHLLDDSTSDGSQKQVLTHMRSIGERKYTVQQITIDGATQEDIVETNMDEDQIEAFKAEWEEKWKPSIDHTDDAKGIRGFVRNFLK